jgi:hypothetical protein
MSREVRNQNAGMGDLFERAQRSAPMPTPTPIDDEQRSVRTITAKTGLALDDLPLCQAGPVSAPAPIGAGPYRLAGLRSAELDDEPLTTSAADWRSQPLTQTLLVPHQQHQLPEGLSNIRCTIGHQSATTA